MAIERELKFSTTDEHVPSPAELRLALGASRLELSAPLVRRHTDRYFDDEQGRLAAAGWALRLRRGDASASATLKGEAVVAGALHARREVEEELSLEAAAALEAEGRWPAAIAAALPSGVDGERLLAQVELRVRRVALLALRAGTPLAELAFDEVTCALPPRPRQAADERDWHGSPRFTFHEVEVEALTGARGGSEADGLAAINELAEAVGAVLPLTPSTTTKLERAKVLLGPFLEDAAQGAR